LLFLTFLIAGERSESGFLAEPCSDVLDLAELNAELASLQINSARFDRAGLTTSIDDMRRARMPGMPDGVTIGGLVLKKISPVSDPGVVELASATRTIAPH
jgi:hypothetical protein